MIKEHNGISKGAESVKSDAGQPVLRMLVVLQPLMPGTLCTKTPLHSPIFAIGNQQA